MTNTSANYMTHLFRAVMLVLLLCAQMQFASAELILTAPPREKADAGKALYGPLAERLSNVLNEKVTYKHPGNWLAYQHEMRKDAYDIIFDGPHFISWRSKNRKHTPVAKLPGTLQFYIVGRSDNATINKPEDLIGKKICGIPPPNLGTLTVYAAYKYPARQPVIVPIRGGFKKVYQAFAKGRCEAAVFRTKFYDKKLTDEQRKITKILLTSEPLTNQGISVSSRVSKKNSKLIADTVSRGNRIPATKNILKRFGGKAKSFKRVSSKDYIKDYKYLEGIIFGW